MINITLSALIKILLNNKIDFLISQANDVFHAGVIRMCVAPYVPQQHYTDKEWQDESYYDRFMKKDGQVCLHYHMEKQCVISICEKWRDIINKELAAYANKTRV